jgi:hypothetical protein
MSDISEGYHDYADYLEELEEEEKKRLERLSYDGPDEYEIQEIERNFSIESMDNEEFYCGTEPVQERYNKLLLSEHITPVFIKSTINEDCELTKIFDKHTYAYDALVIIEHSLDHPFVYHGNSTSNTLENLAFKGPNDKGFMYKTLFAVPIKNIWIKIIKSTGERYDLNNELKKNKDIYKTWCNFNYSITYGKKIKTKSMILTNIKEFSKLEILDILNRHEKNELVVEFSAENSKIINLKDIYNCAVLKTVLFNKNFAPDDLYYPGDSETPSCIEKCKEEKGQRAIANNFKYDSDEDIPF